MQETSDTNGQTYTVQYFERAVFEYHLENQPPNDVLVSLLGVFQYNQKYPNGAPGQRASNDNPYLFVETGKSIGGVFRQYWETHGGLAQQGYPISEEFSEISDLDGKTYTVQYFERSVFEYHPENTAPYNVLLSQLGTLRYRSKYQSLAPSPSPTPAQAAVTDRGLNSVYMVSPTEGWAVGDVGTILHYTQGRWQLVPSPVQQDQARNLASIYMLSPNEGWAVGTFSTLVHYTGGNWEDLSHDPNQHVTGEHLNGVKMVSQDEGWAVGGGASFGVVMHYAGSHWSLQGEVLPHTVLMSLDMVSPSEGWIVGDKILHLSNGTWTEVPRPVIAFLRSVFMVSPTEGWAVGDRGTILHYIVGSWISQSLPGQQLLTGVYMVSPTDGWAVGSGIMHYDGTAWKPVSGTEGLALNSLYMTSADEGWAVGAQGTIVHYMNGAWTIYR